MVCRHLERATDACPTQAARRIAFPVSVMLFLGGSAVSFGQGPRPVSCDQLITSVNTDDAAGVKVAIQAGCPVSTPLDGSGATALQWSQSLAMTRTLIAAGADVNQVSNLGGSALDNAAFHGNLDIVNALLAAGARPNGPGTWECGPLCEALSSSSATAPQVVHVLLAAHASPDETNCYHVSALFKAVQVRRSSMVADFLAAHANPNVYETFHGDSMILVAAAGGNGEIVQSLLASGAHPDWPNPRSCRTALYAAAAAGNLAIVQLLVAHGADVNATDSGGLTARGVARSSGHADIEAFLAQRGVPAAVTPRTDCVNEVDTPQAFHAWNEARARTREPICATLTHSNPQPSGSR